MSTCMSNHPLHTPSASPARSILVVDAIVGQRIGEAVPPLPHPFQGIREKGPRQDPPSSSLSPLWMMQSWAPPTSLHLLNASPTSSSESARRLDLNKREVRTSGWSRAGSDRAGGPTVVNRPAELLGILPPFPGHMRRRPRRNPLSSQSRLGPRISTAVDPLPEGASE